MILISKIISGGQTGADRAGLDAAMELGIAHGGYCPKGRLAEDGEVPAIYQLIETEDNDYRTRTKLNVDNADITLLFTYGPTDGGTFFTQKYATETNKKWLHLSFGVIWPPEGDYQHAVWLRQKLQEFRAKLGRDIVLNVAGNRESKSPRIHERTLRLLTLTLDDEEFARVKKQHENQV